MLYARSDVKAFSGVDDCPVRGHTEPADGDDDHFSIDCGPCEAHLRSDPLWAPDPRDVPLTDAEERDLDERDREAQRGSAEMGLALQDLLREKVAERASGASDVTPSTADGGTGASTDSASTKPPARARPTTKSTRARSGAPAKKS